MEDVKCCGRKEKLMTGKMIAAALLATALSPLANAQELQVGSNAYVDMYFADWHASKRNARSVSLGCRTPTR